MSKWFDQNIEAEEQSIYRSLGEMEEKKVGYFSGSVVGFHRRNQTTHDHQSRRQHKKRKEKYKAVKEVKFQFMEERRKP